MSITRRLFGKRLERVEKLLTARSPSGHPLSFPIDAATLQKIRKDEARLRELTPVFLPPGQPRNKELSTKSLEAEKSMLRTRIAGQLQVLAPHMNGYDIKQYHRDSQLLDKWKMFRDPDALLRSYSDNEKLWMWGRNLFFELYPELAGRQRIRVLEDKRDGLDSQALDYGLTPDEQTELDSLLKLYPLVPDEFLLAPAARALRATMVEDRKRAREEALERQKTRAEGTAKLHDCRDLQNAGAH